MPLLFLPGLGGWDYLAAVTQFPGFLYLASQLETICQSLLQVYDVFPTQTLLEI